MAVAKWEDEMPEVLTAYPTEMNESFIQIRATSHPRQIITVIELLSPANKTPGSEGREEYVKKQREVLGSGISLVEIDLLRRGAHTIAAPEESLRAYGDWEYLACLRRSTERYTYEFWRISLQQRLPRIRIPLTGDLPDVLVSLQTAFERTYEAGRYEQLIDYTEDPIVSLTEEKSLWMHTLLRGHGFRT